MLTVQAPLLLALLGTALMAVVIFAPTRVSARVTVSALPASAQPVVEQLLMPATAWAGIDPHAAPDGEPPPSPSWPTQVDHRAASCGASARLDLIEALATIRSPWADAILRSAADDDPDESVRDAAATALRV